MGVDVLKVLKKEAMRRKKQERPVAPERKYEPMHGFFVSENWKKLLERKPSIAPKSAARASAPEHLAPQVVALDCEMVGVGPDGKTSALARVSIVDDEGNILLDSHVFPDEPVTDYRTHVTGIVHATLHRRGVMKTNAARSRAADLMEGKVIVGHSLQNDFRALNLAHPYALIRDVALFRPLRPEGRENKIPSLQRMTEYWLHETIHEGVHDSVEDARMALRLYKLKSRHWTRQVRNAMSQWRAGNGPGGIGSSEEVEEGEVVGREHRGGEALSSSRISRGALEGVPELNKGSRAAQGARTLSTKLQRRRVKRNPTVPPGAAGAYARPLKRLRHKPQKDP